MVYHYPLCKEEVGQATQPLPSFLPYLKLYSASLAQLLVHSVTGDGNILMPLLPLPKLFLLNILGFFLNLERRLNIAIMFVNESHTIALLY